MAVICGHQRLTKIAAIFFRLFLLLASSPGLSVIFRIQLVLRLFFCLISVDYCAILWLLLDDLSINQQKVYYIGIH